VRPGAARRLRRVSSGPQQTATPRVALVTGAGSGIGRATAVALARDGYRVVLTGRRVDALEQTAAAALDPTAMLVAPGDVTRADDVRHVFDLVRQSHGRLDVLFNNAGMSLPPTGIDELDPEVWNEIVAVNLTGVFLCTQAAFRLMREQTPRGGRIINNGSISAHVPRPLSAAYTATKHAVTGLTRSTSLDGRAYDIACGQIDIGNAATSLAADAAEGTRSVPGSGAAEPFMDVEHAAAAVLFMANLPLQANVQFMTVMATTMPYIGRG
jgi:NAD(P)-dependent dehydrogenase (short-subunit alcohol dehydrogenase family)